MSARRPRPRSSVACLGEAALGNYRYGARIGMLPAMAVFEAGSYVVFPAFSRISMDKDRLLAAFLRALRWMWFVTVPLAVLLVALGEQAVIVVLGQPWRDAGLFSGGARRICPWYRPTGGGQRGDQSCRPVRLAQLDICDRAGARSELDLVLLPLGLVGVGLAISVTEITIGFVLLALAKPIVGYRLGKLVRMWPPRRSRRVSAWQR